MQIGAPNRTFATVRYAIRMREGVAIVEKSHPIGLSDRAMSLVQRHAKALPVDQRDKFDGGGGEA